jgi:uncharacterized membrane protein YgcG
VGVTAIVLSGLVFGLHSAIDWTWFVPGAAVMGIFAAAFAAGRGPVHAVAAAGAPSVDISPAPALPRSVRGWLTPRNRGRIGVAAGVVAAALLTAWAVEQPERADSTTGDALTLVAKGDFKGALSKADKAHSINPLSPKPLLVKSAVQDSAGDKQGALHSLEDAVIGQPSNPQLWMKLAQYQLDRLHNPQAAIASLKAALYLDPLEQAAQQQFLEASAALRGDRSSSSRRGNGGASSGGGGAAAGGGGSLAPSPSPGE